jgi:hypothetical protein
VKSNVKVEGILMNQIDAYDETAEFCYYNCDYVDSTGRCFYSSDFTWNEIRRRVLVGAKFSDNKKNRVQSLLHNKKVCNTLLPGCRWRNLDEE